MDVFEATAGEDYEQVVFCNDRASGLRAIIAIHSTALGPALGGTRYWPFESEAEALTDVLRLSKAMSYKNAAAGLDLGGGKAVIMAPEPGSGPKSEALLRAYGRFIDALGGRYITAEDVGTTGADMDMIRRETRWVTGISPTDGGSGDPSPATAYGVMQGLRAVAIELWGEPSLAGRRAAVQGVGKVGHALVGHLKEAGAEVVVADVNPVHVEQAVADYGVEVEDTARIHAVDCDLFCPCALGGGLNDLTIPELRCAAVAGAANNQLLRPHHADALAQRGILYVPDFIINAGGVINVADELNGYDERRAHQRIEGIFGNVARVLETARKESLTPSVAANRVAEERIRSVGRVRLIRGAQAATF
ncbi:MAG TPA: Glu/Leu/Phe/Val dehydrogenase [Actinomycetota bacterium]|nr:Glu/Leu/Phe/Val dehydrogenase [Actinomycetota bacterium]